MVPRFAKLARVAAQRRHVSHNARGVYLTSPKPWSPAFIEQAFTSSMPADVVRSSNRAVQVIHAFRWALLVPSYYIVSYFVEDTIYPLLLHNYMSKPSKDEQEKDLSLVMKSFK
ncbi:MAG: hypothetical protein MHM6MM_006556 [Cercozoa sp. M6MM]